MELDVGYMCVVVVVGVDVDGGGGGDIDEKVTSEGTIDDEFLFFCNLVLSESAVADLGRPGNVDGASADDDDEEEEEDNDDGEREDGGAEKYDKGAGNLSSVGMSPSRYPPKLPLIIIPEPLRLKLLEGEASWKCRLRQSNADSEVAAVPVPVPVLVNGYALPLRW